MHLSKQEKQSIKEELVAALSGEKEVVRIVIFGSFIESDNPHDMDVAVFQKSSEKYLPLAMKYRRATNKIADKIPLDIIPLKSGIYDDPFLSEMEHGEIVYEKSN